METSPQFCIPMSIQEPSNNKRIKDMTATLPERNAATTEDHDYKREAEQTHPRSQASPTSTYSGTLFGRTVMSTAGTNRMNAAKMATVTSHTPLSNCIVHPLRRFCSF